MNLTIETLKKHLGPGLGLRKNRYMLELPVPTVNGETLNILCQSAGLPEINNNAVDVWHKGRKYRARGETDFGGEYEISIIDDSDMNIRQLFDTWMKQIDNTRPDGNSSLLGASFEAISPGLINELGAASRTGNMIKNALKNPRQATDFFIGLLDENMALSGAMYQTDINIWQMDRGNNPVYGYKLQNAFPKSIGIVTLEDADENTLSQFSVTFAFSEFIPLKGIKKDIIGSIVGDQTVDVVDGFKKMVSN